MRTSANSFLVIPTAAANASCWITFILPNSAADPAWRDISLANVPKSLFKAACLAFSRFKFFPVNSSASISLEIELSKSKRLLPILSTLLNSKPNFLALKAAIPKLVPWPLEVNTIAELAFATSFITSLSLRAIFSLAFNDLI